MTGTRWEQAQKDAKEMFRESPDRNPQEDLRRTPKAQPKTSAMRKSPIRQYWDKAKDDGSNLKLSPSNRDVHFNFAARKDKEVEELKEQLKELRNRIEKEREKNRTPGQPSVT